MSSPSSPYVSPASAGSDPTTATLTEKFGAFQDRGRQLIAEVRLLLPGLLNHGQPIPPSTLQAMAAYKQKYVALCEFAWPNRSAPVGAPTFEHFQARLTELAIPPAAPAPADPVAQAKSLIAIPGSEALVEMIRSKISEPPESCKDRVNVIAADLLTLISGDDTVSDERWQQLLESVTTLFGREVALAAARGKLKLPSA